MQQKTIKNWFLEFWKDFTETLYSRVVYTISWFIPGLSIIYFLEKWYLWYQDIISYILIFFIWIVAWILQDWIFFTEDKKESLQIFGGLFLWVMIWAIIIPIIIYGLDIPYPLIFCIFASCWHITYWAIKYFIWRNL